MQHADQACPLTLERRNEMLSSSRKCSGAMHPLTWLMAWLAWLMAPAVLLALAMSLAFSPAAQAHELRPAIADVRVQADGTLNMRIRLNLEALLAGIGPEHQNTQDAPQAEEYNALRKLPPEDLQERFMQRREEIIGAMELKVDGRRVPLVFDTLKVPPVGDIRLARSSTLVLHARLPLPAQAFTWRWPRTFGDIVLRVALPQGAAANGGDAATRTASATDAENAESGQQAGKGGYVFAGLVRAGQESPPISLHGIEPPSGWDVFWQYVVVGFEHILPKGMDHILFVVGLFLFSASIGSLLWQISSFTLAHTITLGLAMAGYIAAPPAIVEPLIALSIVYVAVENMVHDRLYAWRPLLIFLFGLLHGLGFASVLTEIGMPEGAFTAGLVGFNIGVELGQLAVIALCFLAVGLWFRHKSWYRSRITVPASLVVAAIGAWWFLERTLLA